MANSLNAAWLLVGAAALTACDVRVGEQGGVSVEVARGKAADEWVRTYSLPAGGDLSISNVNGAIEVTGAAGGEVEVRVRREAEGPSEESAREALGRVEIIEEKAPDRVRVEVRRPPDSFAGWRRSRVAVTYRIRLPHGLQASFRTENGAIRLSGAGGRLTATTANGPIEGQGLSGALVASAVNGGVQASFDATDGPIELRAVNGPIRLELPAGVEADLSASAVNGNVTLDEGFGLSPGSEPPRRTPGVSRVSGRLNGGGSAITADAVNGGVRILRSTARAGVPAP